MRTYNQVKIVKSVTSGFYCDWCKKEIVELRDDGFRNRMILHGGNITVRAWGPGWKIQDLCNDCSDKLRMLLSELGITIVDWNDECPQYYMITNEMTYA